MPSDDFMPKHFSSSDFSRTQSRLTARVPARLIHEDIEGLRGGGTNQRSEAFEKERKHPVHLVDLPSTTISMTLGGLAPAQATNRHRHNYETLIYVLEGRGATTIEDRTIEWRTGDAFYVPVWAWHHHRNLSETQPCRYLACENAPLLQNLGRLDLREEEG